MVLPMRLGLSMTAAALVCLLSPLARAEIARTGTGKEAPAKTYRFKGLALYAGGGAGMLPDIDELTQNWRLLITVPFASWAMFEGFGFGYHFVGDGQHGREDALGLGLGVGTRFAPPPDAPIRPHAAFRFEHIHLSPDLWGPVEAHGDAGTHDYTSVHRWALALGVGLDAALLRKTQRLRAGFDVEAMVLSGPGTNVGISAIALIGYAL